MRRSTGRTVKTSGALRRPSLAATSPGGAIVSAAASSSAIAPSLNAWSSTRWRSAESSPAEVSSTRPPPERRWAKRESSCASSTSTAARTAARARSSARSTSATGRSARTARSSSSALATPPSASRCAIRASRSLETLGDFRQRSRVAATSWPTRARVTPSAAATSVWLGHGPAVGSSESPRRQRMASTSVALRLVRRGISRSTRMSKRPSSPASVDVVVVGRGAPPRRRRRSR